MSPPAASARLVFRTWGEEDLPLAYELFSDPRVSALVGGPFEFDQIRERLAAEIATERTHGFQYWPVFSRSGEHLGCCGLKPRAPGMPELGFYFRYAAWGRGYATEAAAAVIAHAFGELRIDALFAGHHHENHGSRHALAKLGFRYTHHELYPPTGLDEPCYVLRKPEDVQRSSA
jgi:RimJ/RimL family protein N-acetyltransferase